MILFGVGQWGHWRHLFALASIPLCLVGFPWLSGRFAEWHSDWYHSPWLYVGTCIIASLVAFAVRRFYRRSHPLKPSDPVPLLKEPVRATKLAVIVLGVGGCIYGGDYLLHSLRGRFEPEVIGLNGVKWYAWAPSGFVQDFKWNHSRKRFYYGLWFADGLFWHRSDAAYGDTYPVNSVETADIWKVYRAWR